jgi:hypothetical protein
MEVLKERGSPSRVARCEALLKKLAEDRFTLAVVGQFQRGKSSLMNAVIGRELLPTGPLPLTSTVTVLKFGPVERLVVGYKGSRLTSTFPMSALVDFVTEPGNPGNRRRVTTVTVEVPLPFLKRPGICRHPGNRLKRSGQRRRDLRFLARMRGRFVCDRRRVALHASRAGVFARGSSARA